MRILVCGDRNWTDTTAILRELFGRRKETEAVIHGAARGADSLTGLVARSLKLPVLEFPALWDKHGLAAGPIRNQRMLDEGRPDLVLAFHANIAASKGTADMLARARKAGIPTEVFTV